MSSRNRNQNAVKQARAWTSNIRAEIRTLERSIRDLDREEKKVIQSMKEAAKRKDERSTKILARSLVDSRKQKEKLYIARGHLMGISTTLQGQIATMRVAGCMKQSADIMHRCNELASIPEMNHMMMTLGREMEKAGLIEEMVSESLESVLETDEVAVEEEVSKVLDELLIDFETKAPNAPIPTKEEEKEELTEEDRRLESQILAL